MAFKIVVLIALAAVVNAGIVPVAPAGPVLAKIEDFDAVPQYSFAYDVQDSFTGDSKAQYETRNGDIVQGSYSLIEPDGNRRIVDYTADPINGFNAVVSREPAAIPVAPVVAKAAPVVARASPLVATAPVVARTAHLVAAAPLEYSFPTIPRAVAARLNVPIAAPLTYPAPIVF